VIALTESGYWLGSARDLPSPILRIGMNAQDHVAARLSDRTWVREAKRSPKPFYVNALNAGDQLTAELIDYGHTNRPYYGAELSHVGVFVSGLVRVKPIHYALGPLGELLWEGPWMPWRGTQIPHFDVGDPRHIKLFVLLSNVGRDSGPLTFWSAPDSAPLNRGRSRVDERELDRRKALTLTGPPGTAAIIDVSRCIHYGSRGGSRQTLVLHWCSDAKKYSTRTSARFEDVNVCGR
jgi:hypothetical protein